MHTSALFFRGKSHPFGMEGEKNKGKRKLERISPGRVEKDVRTTC